MADISIDIIHWGYGSVPNLQLRRHTFAAAADHRIAFFLFLMLVVLAATCAAFAADRPQSQAGVPASAAELSPHQKAVLKAKIADLYERYYKGDNAAGHNAIREFESMGADVVTILLEDACTGERSPEQDKRRALVLRLPALKKYTVEQLYPVFSSDYRKLCWGNAESFMDAVADSNHDVEVYTKLLDHPDTAIRVRALMHLEIRKERAAPAAESIAALLAEKDDCIRHSAWLALVHMGSPAVPVLIRTLEHQRASIRYLAADILGRIKPPAQDAVQALIQRLNDKDRSVRAKSLEALRWIGEPKEQIVDALMSALDDESPAVREEAVNNLRLMGRDAIKATPRLLRLKYFDSDDRVRELAGIALDRVGPLVYFYCILLVFLLGLVWRLFLRKCNNRLNKLYGFIATCFGHPLYLMLALYLTYKMNLSSDTRDPSLSNIVGFTTFLILLFLLRYGYFLYYAWNRTRISLETLHPYAAAAYLRAHWYCTPGVLLFIWFLEPLDPSGGIVYMPVFLITGIAGVAQSIYSFGKAFSPERWAPPDEIVVARTEEEMEHIPLDSKDERNRRIARVIAYCLGLVIAIVAVIGLAGDRDRENYQEVHARKMLAREKPGTAMYHHMLGEKYAGYYPSDRSGDMKKRSAQALEEYNKTIAADPNFARAYKGRGHAYYDLNDYERALEDYNTFERLSDVVDSQFYISRARAYKSLNMVDKMCEDRLKASCGYYSRDSYKRLVEEGLCKY
jgi:HEAT repeat protein